ncbi:MAG: hypothetical protein AAB556_01095 [Patescibacteria group bacterium]
MKGLLAFVLVFLASCGPARTHREQLLETGMFKEHQLLRLENFGSVTGSVSGGFFLGTGSVNGTVGSEYRLQFWWSPKPGELVATTFPYQKFRFVVDDTLKAPSVEFLFDEGWLKSTWSYFDETEKYDLNDFMGYIKVAKVKIPQKVLEEEIFLPKLTN